MLVFFFFKEQCAGYQDAITPQYCTPSKFAYPFAPTLAFLSDVPAIYRDDLTTLLTDQTGGTKSNLLRAGLSKMAGMPLLFASLNFLGFLPLSVMSCTNPDSRWVAIGAAAMAGGTFQSIIGGVGLWTYVIINLKHSIKPLSVIGSDDVPLGIEVAFGGGFWILWLTAFTTLAANLAFSIVSIIILDLVQFRFTSVPPNYLCISISEFPSLLFCSEFLGPTS